LAGLVDTQDDTHIT